MGELTKLTLLHIGMCMMVLMIVVFIMYLDDFRILWKNRRKIFEGVWNTWFPNTYVENIAKRRIEKCRTNRCGFYDPDGSSENAYVKGAETCGSCGCKLEFKVRSLSSYCTLKDLDREPLWEAEMTQEEEDKFNEKIKTID